MGENIRRRSFPQLSHLSRTTQLGYHALSSPQLDLLSRSPTQNMVSQDLSKSSTPIPPSQNSPSISTSPIVSTSRGNSPAQYALPTRGTISIMGQNLPMGTQVVNTPPPNTSIVVPSSDYGGPSWIQPNVSPHSWGYTYLGNQPPTIHQVYQPPLQGLFIQECLTQRMLMSHPMEDPL